MGLIRDLNLPHFALRAKWGKLRSLILLILSSRRGSGVQPEGGLFLRILKVSGCRCRADYGSVARSPARSQPQTCQGYGNLYSLSRCLWRAFCLWSTMYKYVD